MSLRPLRLASSALPAMRARQMSQPKTFVPRLSSGRILPFRPLAPPELSREDFLHWWSGLMLRKLGTARAIARKFDRTEQTGRNWIDAVACPTGLDVMRAMEFWPDEFAAAPSRMGRAA